MERLPCLQWALNESEHVVRRVAQVDVIVARLLYHYVDKMHVARLRHVQYASVVVHGKGEWTVHKFLEMPFEADYAAAFERSVPEINGSENHIAGFLNAVYIHDPQNGGGAENETVVGFVSRLLRQDMWVLWELYGLNSALSRHVFFRVQYYIELFFSSFVWLAFRIYAGLSWLQGWTISYYNLRIAKEMYFAIVSDYDAWKGTMCCSTMADTGAWVTSSRALVSMTQVLTNKPNH